MMPYYVIGVKLGFSVDSLCKEGFDDNITQMIPPVSLK